MLKSFLEDDTSTIYYDDISKVKFNEENRRKYVDLINSVKNQTSREELIKRLR